MKDIGHTFGCVDPCAHSINFHGTDINAVILEIKHDGTVLWKGREVESDADFRAAMMEVKRHLCGSANDEITRVRADLAQRTAERDALAAEVAALKANDPLAEMWAALADYQPQADRDGHGESWRIMCEERTEDAALAASRVATWVAARAAGYAARAAAAARSCAAWASCASCAVAEIRRAKEAKP
jgi:hypothetical protein